MHAGVGALLGVMLALVPAWSPGPALAFDSYAAVKRVLYNQVFADQRQTLYCACPFSADRRPDLKACGYDSLRHGKRASRIEVEHVVPASWIGVGRRCWSNKICRDASGKPFKGRKCCLAIDPAFRAAYQDLHNLWPTIGEVNEIRSNYRPGLIAGEARRLGRCDFEIDKKRRLIEPRPEIRGDIARISLYMEATHGIRLSNNQRRLLQGWHHSDPPDQNEVRRHQIIERLQGRRNAWVVKPGTR